MIKGTKLSTHVKHVNKFSFNALFKAIPFPIIICFVNDLTILFGTFKKSSKIWFSNIHNSFLTSLSFSLK